MRIFLIGYMCSGKTTFGTALSQQTGSRFIDLDNYIEEKTGCSIEEIFSAGGEEGFRRTESRMLQQVCNEDYEIIACGGGTPCYGDNLELLKKYGQTVWLKPNHSRLMIRLKEGRKGRPLIANLNDDELEKKTVEILCQREPYYSKADIILDSTELDTPEEINKTVIKFIKDYLKLPSADQSS